MAKNTSISSGTISSTSSTSEWRKAATVRSVMSYAPACAFSKSTRRASRPCVRP